MSTIEATIYLSWTLGVTGPGNVTKYYGPGPAQLPLDRAIALSGGNMARAVYHYEGKKYTPETLGDAPEGLLLELRRRGIDVPEVQALPPVSLRDIPSVTETLEEALIDAGYDTLESIAGADPEELALEVSGVGAVTARKLIKAAQGLVGPQEDDE